MPTRYGIGEIFGRDFCRLSPTQIRSLTAADFKHQICPFMPNDGKCHKRGGVCTIRPYEKTPQGAVRPGPVSTVTATCPVRFGEARIATKWVGEVLLGTTAPLVITEIPFLMSDRGAPSDKPATVGKIDMVLVQPDTRTLRWCALETQSVYFSGSAMSTEFQVLKNWKGPGLPYPEGNRHPDFRSSGPKRLMPQLQVKAPTLARWGKKMAVVIDLPFWLSLGDIREEDHVSNCDVAWFVMKYVEKGIRLHLQRESVHFTTLERAVEGLTGGAPTSREAFERALLSKLRGRRSP